MKSKSLFDLTIKNLNEEYRERLLIHFKAWKTDEKIKNSWHTFPFSSPAPRLQGFKAERQKTIAIERTDVHTDNLPALGPFPT